ncbi:MAG: T9SS type A sorting domain-containing protein, partial [Candidatus Lokiarchaeota archaeon]|nr:T9SS type A sorting domain-containing protein [Candidatus Lokiarchaeota archaeon]
RLYNIDAARQCYEYVNKIYEYYGAEDSLYFVEKPGGHGYSEETRPLIFQFFVRHLMNTQMTPEEIGDIDEFELSDEELRVFVDGPPADDITTEIQDTFVKQSDIPHVQNIGTLEAHRSALKRQLTEKTFRAFPADTPDADTALVLHSADGNLPDTTVFTFTSEQEWILKVDIRWRNPVEQNSPMMLVVRNAYQDKNVAEELMAGLHPRWNIAYLDVRGVGDTEWSSYLEWYIRRSLAWTGRTLASTRVYDVLRCLQILRNMDGIDPDRLGIAATDEMTAVALYAAFMDGNVPVTLLKSPPATQDAPDDSIGAGLEMLNVLRFTDLSQVAGMLFPAELVIVDEMPSTFSWAQSLYHILGKPEIFQHVANLAQWQPVTAVKNNPPEKPLTFHLYQNYPNPFNAGTKITYHLSGAGNVSLKIYNIRGEEIRTLIDEYQNSGMHTTSWNGKNDQGHPVSSGVYICKLKSVDYIRAVRMVVLR